MKDHRDWVTEGVFPVADGVHRIPLPLPDDGLRAVNVYVIESANGPVLVDSGWGVTEAREQLLRSLTDLGYDLQDVQRFLVTHAHRDHYEQAVHLQREFGTSVSLGVGERPSLERLQEGNHHPFEPQFQILTAFGATSLAESIRVQLAHVQPAAEDWRTPDTWLAAGDIPIAGRPALAVVPTPGHTAGHVVFHDVAGALMFTGDHVLPAITPSVGFEPILSPTALSDFLGSLARVRRLPDATMLPAHGPVSPSVHARVDELLEHHDVRLEQALAAISAGAETGLDVASVLRWTRRDRSLTDLDPFNQMLALAETAVHLDLLEAQGRVRWAMDGEVRRYQVV